MYSPLPVEEDKNSDHTTKPGKFTRRRKLDDVEADLKFIRTLFPAARTGPAIIAVSEDAWRLGVRPGMPLAEARSMAQPVIRKTASSKKTAAPPAQVIFHEWQPHDDRQGLAAAAELTRRFAPIVGLDQMPTPDSLMLDITGCGQLFGGESTLAEQLLKELRTAGYRARIAIADTIAVVWAFAHFDAKPSGHSMPSLQSFQNQPVVPQKTSRKNRDLSLKLPVLIMPPGQHDNALEQLPLSAARLLPGDTAVLSQLGLLSIRQLKQLPTEDLPARLSADAVERVAQLNGIQEEWIQPIPEASPVAAEWASEFPAKNHADLLQVLDHLIQRICEQLERRRVGCIRLTSQLHCINDGENSTEDSMPSAPTTMFETRQLTGSKNSTRVQQQLVVETVKPTQSAKLLMDIVTLRLEAMKLALAVDRVSMTAATSPLPVVRQKDLFDDTQHFIPTEELSTLITRLNSRLGAQSVLIAQKVADVRPEHTVRLQPVVANPDAESISASREDVVHQLVTPTESDFSSTSLANMPRPVRLLPAPFLLPDASGEALISQGISWQGNRLSISRIIGPERLLTAWWLDETIQRDYYRVLTYDGPMLWIYKDLSTGSWWLHGFFD